MVLCLNLFSCRKVDPSWDVNINAPLLKTTMDLDNILPDSLINTNNDHSLSLVYSYSFYNFSFDSLIDMPDTLSSRYLPPVNGYTVNPGQVFYNLTENNHLSFQGAQISGVDFHSGYITLEVFSSITEPIVVTYELPYATRDGIPFKVTVTVPASTPGTIQHYQNFFDISGYSLDMRGPTHLNSNILTSTTKAMLDPSGNGYTLDSSDVFRFNIRFKDISLQYAKGYFGNNSFAFGPDTTPIDIFNKITSGAFDFESIKLNLNVKNGFGVDARVMFDQISSINTATGHHVALNDPIIGQAINISRAVETGDHANPVTPSEYSFNLGNSNILDLIENVPDMISYKVHVDCNPLGNISSGNDFIYYGNYLDASLDMEIPLSLIANDLTLTDTVDFDLGDNPNTIKSGTLTLLADNGFPFSAKIQLYMLDENRQITDSLLFPDMIAAPDINAFYKVVHPKRSVLQIPLPEEKIPRLYEMKKMLLVARFNTAGAGHYVKIYDYYKLSLKLTGDFNYLIQM